MEMSEVKKRFIDEIKLRAFDDKYVDKGEEREILQIAIQQGISIDSARSSLSSVCENQGYVLESNVLRQVKDLIDTFAGNDGKIDEKEFNDAVSMCKKASQGKRTDVQVKRMVLEVIDDNAYKVKTGMFSNWHKNVKREVGLA